VQPSGLGRSSGVLHQACAAGYLGVGLQRGIQVNMCVCVYVRMCKQRGIWVWGYSGVFKSICVYVCVCVNTVIMLLTLELTPDNTDRISNYIQAWALPARLYHRDPEYSVYLVLCNSSHGIWLSLLS